MAQNPSITALSTPAISGSCKRWTTLGNATDMGDELDEELAISRYWLQLTVPCELFGVRYLRLARIEFIMSSVLKSVVSIRQQI